MAKKTVRCNQKSESEPGQALPQSAGGGSHGLHIAAAAACDKQHTTTMLNFGKNNENGKIGAVDFVQRHLSNHSSRNKDL